MLRIPRFSVRLPVVLLGCFALQPMLYGAEVSHSLIDEVVMEGPIEPGDCEKLKIFISKQGAHRIYLASPGGNLREAMEIGRLVRTLKLQTIVPGRWGSNEDINRRWAKAHNLKNFEKNYMCASACFFVFVAGIAKDTNGFDPILGIHRPYLSDNDLRGLSYDQALRAGRDTRTKVEAYLKEMSVPAKYSDKLFSIPAEATQWISTDDFEADLQGIIPELKEWVNAKGKAKLKELIEQRKAMDDDNDADVAPQYKERYAVIQRNNKDFTDKYIKRMSEPVTRDAEILNNLADDAWNRMFDVGRVLEPPEKYPSLCGGSN